MTQLTAYRIIMAGLLATVFLLGLLGAEPIVAIGVAVLVAIGMIVVFERHPRWRDERQQLLADPVRRRTETWRNWMYYGIALISFAIVGVILGLTGAGH